MCNYCKLEKQDYIYDDGDNSAIIEKTENYGYEIQVSIMGGYGYHHLDFSIEYCPKCGRKLGE